MRALACIGGKVLALLSPCFVSSDLIEAKDERPNVGNDSGVENFFGTDPSAFSQGLVSGTYDAVAGTFTFTHPQNANPADDLTAACQWSKDPQTFYPEGSGDGTTVAFSAATDAGITTVTATVTGTSPDKLFVNVLVTQ